FGGNRQNYHIEWYEKVDDVWELMPDMRDSALLAQEFQTPGTYFYRVVGHDSTFLYDEENGSLILAASHYDTLEIDVRVYDMQAYFRNVASDEVEVPMGGRVEFLTRIEDGSGRYRFDWTPESWVSTLDSTNGTMNTVALFHEGEMTLTVTDSASGCVREATVRVRPGKGNNIPNVITPNGDGYNDIFLKGVSRLTIFTSWGEQIFHTEDGLGWDGSRNGQPVRPGEYLYVAEIDGEDGSVRIVKGVVTVKYE
ncbi:MAG: gliding motility-associated C-terminal domain-containing protein, partial [Bacteroidales bacterium]|nr:gliding motility-associated C-terminal domain-containing protein [Bacteroidales bacterium]